MFVSLMSIDDAFEVDTRIHGFLDMGEDSGSSSVFSTFLMLCMQHTLMGWQDR